MNDPFLDINRVVDRLYNEYKRYGDIIIAFDFDYTVHNFRDEDPRLILTVDISTVLLHFPIDAQ